MPLRLNVGVTKQVGLQEYSSAGASCDSELELPEGIRQWDFAEYRERVRGAYAAAHRAVDDELGRLRERARPPGPDR